MESEEADIPPTGDNPHRQKRSRVLLSCAPCRNSKLKCDRGQPCSQCLKKDRVDLCAYAPKPEKRRPAKGVAARLKRLETMVRGMMDGDGNIDRLASQLQRQLPELSGRKEGELPLPPAQDGNVVKGSNSTTYIGATHCMAMLEDIEDLKEYFDYPDDEDEGDSPGGPLDESGEWIMLSGGVPIDRQELLSKLPEKQVMDRLIVRYFASMSPSQHVVHRPTFTKAYAKFSQNPETASYHWIAQLFMVLAMGIHFNKYQNADETYNDSPVPLDERIKQYRACAGWALVRGRFTQPTFQTLPAFLLYCESHFLFNRAAQMSCYLLSGVLMRLMLKMGLHRDPSKLTNIGPFEGEMRRRVWNMGTQLEAIVSFHVGLPSMIPAIETDVRLPHNLHDEDLNEDCEELPRERPHTDWTVMTYPIHKSRLLAVFSKIGRQAHALQSPIYTEVLRLDEILTETWRSIPSYMYVLPLEDCVGDPPGLLIQRFGLGSLYNKTRCVLHRRYLAEPVPKKEHDFSRQQCLEGAMTLLEYQRIISDACLPGHLLGQNGWFISSLVIHDYLLAAMVIYLVIQNEHYAAQDSEYCWYARGGTSPTKEELKDMLRKSHHIWSTVAEDMAELRKTADTIGVMLERLGEPVEGPPTTVWKTRLAKAGESGSNSAADSFDAATGTSGSEPQAASSSWGYDSSTSGMNSGPDPFMVAQAMNGGETMDIPSVNMNGDQDDMIDPAWMADLNDMDWRYLDVSLAHSQTAGLNAEPGAGSTWTERMPLNNMSDLESVPMNLWGHQDGVWMSNNGTNGL
ncbi:fungal specific transcription factor domain-containing protein [Sarocladium implicatum]|nr:fungal specific transcription factor domain-containing protein [Sarocladium implicatum]